MLTIMFVGGLVLWVGVPVGALYVGSVVQSATDSIGASMAAMAVGDRKPGRDAPPARLAQPQAHGGLRVSRGRQDLGNAALEGVMVVSAGIALVAFLAWFFLFAGASPFPFQRQRPVSTGLPSPEPSRRAGSRSVASTTSR